MRSGQQICLFFNVPRNSLFFLVVKHRRTRAILPIPSRAPPTLPSHPTPLPPPHNVYLFFDASANDCGSSGRPFPRLHFPVSRSAPYCRIYRKLSMISKKYRWIVSDNTEKYRKISEMPKTPKISNVSKICQQRAGASFGERAF